MACSGCAARRQALLNAVRAQSPAERQAAINQLVQSSRQSISTGVQTVTAAAARLGRR